MDLNNHQPLNKGKSRPPKERSWMNSQTPLFTVGIRIHIG
jgi:hypothetical protein